jgi:hypothetical protein
VDTQQHKRKPVPINRARQTNQPASSHCELTSPSGDTATAIPVRERGDEVGAMAQSVQMFKDNMIEADRFVYPPHFNNKEC